MGVIFWMSTDMFSSEHTSQFIIPISNLLFPELAPHQIDMIHEMIRKAGHITEYFIFGMLLFHAFRNGSIEKWQIRWTVYAIIGVVLYAMSDELHQTFVLSRAGSLIDVGIDSIGGILSQMTIILRWQITKRSLNYRA